MERVRFEHRHAAGSGVELSSPHGSSETRTLTFRRTGTGRGYRWFCSECGRPIRTDVTHLADVNGTARLHLGCGDDA